MNGPLEAAVLPAMEELGYCEGEAVPPERNNTKELVLMATIKDKKFSVLILL